MGKKSEDTAPSANDISRWENEGGALGKKHLKRPADPAQRGKLIGDILTGQVEDVQPVAKEAQPEAQEFARRGGKKSGKVRAKALTPRQRSEVARTPAQARWKKS